MTPNPKSARDDELASAVVFRMEKHGIMAMPVLDAEERSHWSNVPYASHHRPGLRLGSLDRNEMLRVHDWLPYNHAGAGAANVCRW